MFYIKKYTRTKNFLLLLFFFALTSCISTSTQNEDTVPDQHNQSEVQSETAAELSQNTAQKLEKEQKKTLILTFAGDLMAHTVNFMMDDYNAIYDDVKHILQTDDLSFINVETPVCDELPPSSYPQFNVHTSYLRAAFRAGFDVFTFANNHTNDQHIEGIDGTLKAIQILQDELMHPDNEHRTFAYSGLKQTTDDPLRVTYITYNGWNILFCGITELLNSYDSSKKRVYYSPSTKEGREALLAFLTNARKEYPCDLFILGIHLNEPEYVRTVSDAKKDWFKQLGEAGIDIIWAHHPHVMQPWEVIQVERIHNTDNQQEKDLQKTKEVLCMYSMGNFISGQRWNVSYDKPAFYREYTGDAVLLQIQCEKKDTELTMQIKPILITQYNELPHPVVKHFTKEWIQTLKKKEQTYFNKRLELMYEYLPFEEEIHFAK